MVVIFTLYIFTVRYSKLCALSNLRFSNSNTYFVSNSPLSSDYRASAIIDSCVCGPMPVYYFLLVLRYHTFIHRLYENLDCTNIKNIDYDRVCNFMNFRFTIASLKTIRFFYLYSKTKHFNRFSPYPLSPQIYNTLYIYVLRSESFYYI